LRGGRSCAVAGWSTLSVAPAGAATDKILYVNGSGVASSGCTEPGAKDCGTITEAIIAAAASPADDVTILVGPGTYVESDDIESIEPGTTLTITGSGQASTAIEGEYRLGQRWCNRRDRRQSCGVEPACRA